MLGLGCSVSAKLETEVHTSGQLPQRDSGSALRRDLSMTLGDTSGSDTAELSNPFWSHYTLQCSVLIPASLDLTSDVELVQLPS